MSGTTTPRMGLPYIAAGQAAPEVPDARSKNIIDAMALGVANSVGDTSPPGSPAEGDVYCLGASPTGAWSGQGGKVAHYVGGGWIFITPRTGWRVYAVDEAADYRWSGSAWVAVAVSSASVTRVKLAANFSVGNNTFTPVTWDTESRDDAGAWSAGSPTIFTIPSGFTKARFSGYHIYAANSTGIRSCEFQVGTTRRQFGAIGASALDQGPCGYVTEWLTVSAGDTFRQGAYQNSGGALNLLGSASGDYAWFQVELLP